MRTAQRLSFGLLMALILVLLIGLVSFASTRRFQSANASIRNSTETLLTLGRFAGHLSNAESAVRGFVLTGDSAYMLSYATASGSLRAEFDSLDGLGVQDSSHARTVLELKRLTTAKLQYVESAAGVRSRLGLDAAVARAATGRGRILMDSINTVTGAMETRARTSLAQQQQRAAGLARLTDAVVGVGAVLACIMLSFAALFMVRQFSERRRAETAVREGQAQLTQFLDSLPIGAFVIDASGQPSFANTTALSMMGAASLHELNTRPHETMIPLWREEDHSPLPAAEDPMRAALRGLAAQREGLEIHVGSDTRIPIEISAAPVFDSNGSVAFAIATFSDITERQRARAAMQLARQAAEDSNRAKSDFLARMSHELRTPLNSVIGFANILLKNKGGTLREQDQTYLTRILDNGKHLLLLINDILDLSKIESGKVQVEWEDVDLHAVLLQTVQQLETQARPGVSLEAVVPEGIETITSDAARLRQIAFNLIGNALKFTREGYVRISVDAEPGTQRPTRIRVKDSGIGIPPDRLQAIFDAFEQADRSTARQYGGTGLGLPISRALCELLGYTLTVRSEPGAGTEFVIDLHPGDKRRTAEDGVADGARHAVA